VDSTVFDDAVATQDTVTQVVAPRRVTRVVPGAAEVIIRVCTLDYGKPGKPDIDWDDLDAKQRLVSDLVNDAVAVLAELTGPHIPKRDTAAVDALGLLALVAGQDVEPAEDSDGTDGRWRIARRVAPDRVISTVDPQARHTRKSRSQRRDGFRGHLAAEPGTGLITDCEMTMAAGEANTDAAVGVKMADRDRFSESVAEGTPGAAATHPDTAGQADIAQHISTADAIDADAAAQAETTGENTTTASTTASSTTAGITDLADTAPPTQNDTAAQAGTGQNTTRGGLQMYGDSAYGTGDARAACHAAGHDVVIKPKPLPSAVPGGFTLDDFTIDENDGTMMSRSLRSIASSSRRGRRSCVGRAFR